MPTEQLRRDDSGILAQVSLGLVGLDDWSDVRALHARALERLIGAFLEADASTAIRHYVFTPEYTEELLGENLIAASLDGHLIGTAG